MDKTIMDDKTINSIISVLNYVIIALLLALSVILFRQNTRLKEALLNITTQTDTIYTTDTVYRTLHWADTIPKVTVKEKIRTDTLYLTPNFENVPDTAYPVPVQLDLVEKAYDGEFRDSTSTATEVRWNAKVIGYDIDGYPRLKGIDFNVRTAEISSTTQVSNTTTIKLKPRRWNVQLGLGCGYGLINRQPDTYVGIHAGYTLY